MSGQTVQVGDSVKIPSAIFADKCGTTRWIKGTVVWIHPLERFCVVSLQLRGGCVRECCELDRLKKINGK